MMTDSSGTARAAACPGAADSVANIAASVPASDARSLDEHLAGSPDHLAVNPFIRLTHPVLQPDGRCPAKFLGDESIVAVAAAYTLRGVKLVASAQLHARNGLHDVHELIDCHELVAADVERFGDVAGHQRLSAVEAIIDEGKAARLFTVAPDLDFAGTGQLGLDDLPADRRRRLLTAAVIRPIRTVNVVIPRDARLQTEVLGEMTAHPLAEQLFPAVAVLRHRRVRVRLAQRSHRRGCLF